MARFRINAGKHYHAVPPLSTLPWVGAQRIERYVTFDPNCAYDAAPYNADDVNKLFGLTFGLKGVHWNSARFGWRWSKSQQCIEVLAYVYKDGIKNWDEQLRFPVVAQVKPGEKVLCAIRFVAGLFCFTVHSAFGEIGAPDGFRRPLGGELVGGPQSLPHYGLTCGFYFGGELTAPHEVTAQIDRP